MIQYISCPEGTAWIDVRNERIHVPSDKQLQQLSKQAKHLGNSYCYIASHTVHAFIDNEGRVWDIVNGWRVTR